MKIFCWDGFPQYAARCVGALAKATEEEVVVIATRPKVPIDGMEKLAGCPVIWVSADENRSLNELIPTALVSQGSLTLYVSGWYIPTFNRFRDEVHVNGGRVIAMLDNNFYLHGIRNLILVTLKSIKFRLRTRRLFDGYFVPGKSSRRLLRFYGVPDNVIRTGVYAADDQLFRAGPPLSQREKKIIYVGQFIERKNVLRMCRAFMAANQSDEWTLELYGSGPLKDALRELSMQSKNQTIFIHDFLQPEELAAKYREARVFCLPSLEEHWGLVVHEAALSGCLLMLSGCIGAREDFEGLGNVISFNPQREGEMKAAFKRMFSMSNSEFDTDGAESARMGLKGAGISKFVKAVCEEM